jgi:hypothetical protein
MIIIILDIRKYHSIFTDEMTLMTVPYIKNIRYAAEMTMMTVPYINIRYYAAEMKKTIYGMRPKNQNYRTAYFNTRPHFRQKKNHHIRYAAEKKINAVPVHLF